ncbi:MAG: metallophosphoesterase [Candidatus Sigynarchaeota archaeon]
MLIWFTADYHLGHANIMKYCHRPFTSTEEMDKHIVDNVASTVKSGDTLYFLGDLAFKKERACFFIERLGDVKLVFIPGNHDSKDVLEVVASAGTLAPPIMDIVVNRQRITLSHYAMRVWNASHFNSWQLYGHSHANLPPAGKQHDVGVDNNGFKPVSMDELVTIMKTRPDNENLVRAGRGI